jgi:hypothetical protein
MSDYSYACESVGARGSISVINLATKEEVIKH